MYSIDKAFRKRVQPLQQVLAYILCTVEKRQAGLKQTRKEHGHNMSTRMETEMILRNFVEKEAHRF